MLPHGPRRFSVSERSSIPQVNLYVNLTNDNRPVFVGLIEDLHLTKKKDTWVIWVKSRTGPNGVDAHKFNVPHDEIVQWVADMFKAEDDKK